MRDNFEDIKVGDVVIVHEGGASSDRRVAKVAKVKKLHFQIEGSDSNYRKESGRVVASDRWGVGRAARPKPGEVEAINAEVRARNARYFVQKHIESIRHDPAAFIPLAEFIKESMKCSDATS